MAEIWGRPTEMNKKQLIELLDDNLIYSMIWDLIREIRDNDSPDNRKDFDKWKVLSKRLIYNGKASILTVELEDIIYNISDIQNSEENIEKDIKSQERFERKSIFSSIVKTKLTDTISKQIKITDIAIKYGLKLKGNKCVCPFHNDKDPSLTFSDKKGVFHCFGCNEKGNILTFIKKMEELRDDNNNGSKK